MATYEQGTPTRETAAALRRTCLLVAITAVETAALASWLGLVLNAPTASPVTGVAFALLATGLLVAFVLTDVAVNGRGASVPDPGAIPVVLTETVLWGLWLLVASRVDGLAGFAAAGAVFAVLLVSQHTLADNVLRGEGTVATLVDLNAVGFSVVQAAGATVWLLSVLRGDRLKPLLAGADAAFGHASPVAFAALDPGKVGLAALAAALFVEHVVGVSFSRHGERASQPSSPEIR